VNETKTINRDQRARCPICKRIVQLATDGTVWRHNEPRHRAWRRRAYASCAGSGLKAEEIIDIVRPTPTNTVE
jgi:hypothetical protein